MHAAMQDAMPGNERLLTHCRLKASLERLQRLTQGFTDALLAAFPARATALGKALGIEDERIQVSSLADAPAACAVPSLQTDLQYDVGSGLALRHQDALLCLQQACCLLHLRGFLLAPMTSK